MKKQFIYTLLLVSTLLASCSKEPVTFEELRAAGEAAYVKEQFPKAREYLLKAVALQNSDKRSLYLLGMSYGKDYLLDSAFLYLKRADLLHPGDRDINQAIYRIGPELKEWQATLTAIAVLIKTGDDPKTHYGEMAQLSLQDTNIASAHAYYRLAKNAEPDNPSHYLELATTAHQLDSLDLAIALMDSAIAKFGENEQFLSNKAVYLTFEKKYEAAEIIFRKLVSGSTKKLFYELNLANVLASQPSRTKKQEALKMYIGLQNKAEQSLKVDSLITALKKELNEK